jgi:hypothetical protein
VLTEKIAANAVTTGQIAGNAVTTEKIAANAVNTGKIAADAVTNEKIAANAVNTGKIANNSVTTEKINNAAVTNAKLANGVINASKLDTITTVEATESIAANSIGFFGTNCGSGTLLSFGYLWGTNVKGLYVKDIFKFLNATFVRPVNETGAAANFTLQLICLGA